MKTSQTRSRPLPSNEELLSQIRILLDSPEDDLQAAIMKELLAGGGLLAAVPADRVREVRAALDDQGVPNWEIGEAVEGRGVRVG